MDKNNINIISYLGLLAAIFMGCIPVYIMIKIAFADPGNYLNQNEFVFSLSNFKSIFSSGDIWQPFNKSIIVALSVSIISTLISIPGAYVLAGIPGKKGYIILMLIFFTRMFPEVGIALPISVNFIKMGMFDTNSGLILAHLIRVLPLITWILVGTFKAVPKELGEQAKIDGCTKFQVLTKIIVPTAKPGIVVGLIFGFLNSWDEFTYAAYLSLRYKTLPLTVYHYVERGGWFLSSAYALVITVPVLIFTYYFQKHIQSGLLTGAIKN